VLGPLRLPHLLGIGAVVLVLAGGLPSHWFGLVKNDLSEVQRLQSCLSEHSVELASIVTSLGEPQALLGDSPATRAHKVHQAERRGQLERSEGRAVEACARTVSPPKN
jgi:hypothetical protein